MDQLLSILKQCVDSVIQGSIAIAVGFILFSVMERMFSLRPAQKPMRATLLDLQYALLSMLYPPFIYFIFAIVFGWLALQIKATAHDPQISPLLFAGQLLALLFARDCPANNSGEICGSWAVALICRASQPNTMAKMK